MSGLQSSTMRCGCHLQVIRVACSCCRRHCQNLPCEFSSAFSPLLLPSMLLCHKVRGMNCTVYGPAPLSCSGLTLHCRPTACPALQTALQAHDWQLEAAANALLNQQRGAAAGPAPSRSAPPVRPQSLGSPVLRDAGGSMPSSPANGRSPSGKGLVRVSAALASPVWQALGQEFCMVAPADVTALGLC